MPTTTPPTTPPTTLPTTPPAPPNPAIEEVEKVAGSLPEGAKKALEESLAKLKDEKAPKGPRGQLENSIAYLLTLGAMEMAAKEEQEARDNPPPPPKPGDPPPPPPPSEKVFEAAGKLRYSVDPEKPIKDDALRVAKEAPKTHEERITALEGEETPPTTPPPTTPPPAPTL